jgi:antitoxin MazE
LCIIKRWRQAVKTSISKWGNSLAIRLPKAAVETLQVKEGEQVELTIDRDHLEIRPARPHYDLDDLLDQITSDNHPEVFDDASVGDELL